MHARKHTTWGGLNRGLRGRLRDHHRLVKTLRYINTKQTNICTKLTSYHIAHMFILLIVLF